MNGDRRRGPLVSVIRTASAMAGKPPMPEAMIVAVRSCASGVSATQPACASASLAAASANRIKRSIFFCSFTGTVRSGLNPPSASSRYEGTTPPTLACRSATTSSGKRRKPERPANNRCHTVSTPQPRGVTAPIPVTTIRRILIFCSPPLSRYSLRTAHV